MSCTQDQLAQVSEEEMGLCPTHVTPSFTIHPRTGDVYAAYNKPIAVIDWLARNNVEEDYVLVIDADMIMMQPFTAETVGAHLGWAVAAYFPYMKGVNNGLALKHVPEVVPRNDTLAGPVGRRGDMCGGFTLMHRDDLRRVAPLWLRYTEDVRFDEDAWELTGDQYSTHKGDKPWISEMYGYSYAASKADVWHTVHHSAMIYPAYEAKEQPMVLHYGLKYRVAGTKYQFDKHWHYDFDALKCPPWNLTVSRGPEKGGLFPHPPHPNEIKTQGFSLLRDLLAIAAPATLNAAFCERHLRVCPPSEQLTSECSVVKELETALDARLREVLEHLPDPCSDTDTRCASWAGHGECLANQGWMEAHCPVACKKCVPRSAKVKQQAIEAAPQPPPLSKDVVAEAAKHTKDAPVALTDAAAGQAKSQGAAEGKEVRALGDADSLVAAATDKSAEQVASVEDVMLLQRRCRTHTDWNQAERDECLRKAALGLSYSKPEGAKPPPEDPRQAAKRFIDEQAKERERFFREHARLSALEPPAKSHGHMAQLLMVLVAAAFVVFIRGRALLQTNNNARLFVANLGLPVPQRRRTAMAL